MSKRTLGIIVLAAAGAAACAAGGREPDVHPEYPIGPKDLSPPRLGELYECQESVLVVGQIEDSTVKVFVTGEVDPIGTAHSDLAWKEVALDRPLEAGEVVEALYEVGSARSAGVKGTVQPLPTVLPTPVVRNDVVDCGRCLVVNDVLPGARVYVTARDAAGNETSSGSGSSATRRANASAHPPLQEGHRVTALQVACEGVPEKEKRSESAPVPVGPATSPLPPVGFGPWVVGAESLVVKNLVVGAHLRISRDGSTIWQGCAPETSAVLPLADPMEASTTVSAVQTLCPGSDSEASDAGPARALQAPAIDTPVHAGTPTVSVRQLDTSATLVVERTGSANDFVAYGGVVGNPTVMTLTRHLKVGDQVRATQYVGTNAASSGWVPVLGTPQPPVPDPDPDPDPDPEPQLGIKLISATPDGAPRGATVTLSGHNLDQVAEVRVSTSASSGGALATIHAGVTPTSLSFTVPAAASVTATKVRIVPASGASVSTGSLSFDVHRTDGPFTELTQYPIFDVDRSCPTGVAYTDVSAVAGFPVTFSGWIHHGSDKTNKISGTVQGGTTGGFPGIAGLGGLTVSDGCRLGIAARKENVGSGPKQIELSFYRLALDSEIAFEKSSTYTTPAIIPKFQDTSIPNGYSVFLSPDETLVAWVGRTSHTNQTQLEYVVYDLVQKKTLASGTANVAFSAGDFRVDGADNRLEAPGITPKKIQ